MTEWTAAARSKEALFIIYFIYELYIFVYIYLCIYINIFVYLYIFLCIYIYVCVYILFISISAPASCRTSTSCWPGGRP